MPERTKVIPRERKAEFQRFIQGAGPTLKVGDMFQNEKQEFVRVKEIRGAKIITELVQATANRELRRKAEKRRRKEQARVNQNAKPIIRREVSQDGGEEPADARNQGA